MSWPPANWIWKAPRPRLADIRALPTRRVLTLAAASAAGSACFAWLFGGFFAEAAVALLAGTAESLLSQLCRRRGLSRIFTDILAAAAGTAVALFCRTMFLPALDADTAIIGALMVLTPGVALTMGVRTSSTGTIFRAPSACWTRCWWRAAWPAAWAWPTRWAA